MGKSVKVHDDTHRALKELKAERRSKSIDEVVRGLIKESTGVPVGKAKPGAKGPQLTAYLKE